MNSIDCQILPGVVKVGKTTKLTITTNGDFYKLFDKLKYTITICPSEFHDKPIDDSFILDEYPYDTIEVNPIDGIISFSYKFKAEQAYAIYIMLNPNQKAKCDKLKRPTHQAFRNAFTNKQLLRIYALDADLYGTIPLRGDTHMHSTTSDGLQDAPILLSNQRAIGLDFCAITEHHYYTPTLDVVNKLAELDTGMKLLVSEEVHNNFMGNIHILNLGGKASVNDIILSDVEAFSKKVFKEAKKLTHIPTHLRKHVAWYKVIKEEINRVGGLAVLSHPYWMLRAYNCPTDVLECVIENGYYDIYEALGGVHHIHNNIEIAAYYDLTARGHKIPIVGCTDVHDSSVPGKADFADSSTIVFKKNNESITDAIMDFRSVAIMSFANEVPKAFGPVRLVKYALFLLDYYYPMHDRLAKASGILMAEYFNGATYLKEAVNKTEQCIVEYTNKYFNGIN